MTRKFGGTGLGLMLSKELAQALGGNLYLIESHAGKGSTFGFTIQASAPHLAKQSAPTNLKAPEDARKRNLDGMSVLLVEDSKDNQIVISRFLQLAGAKVSIAKDGKEGVERALSEPHDVVLMDIQMPIMDGYEAAKTLFREGFRTPIIALTAHALKEEKDKVLAEGFTEYLAKPVEKAKLIYVISQYRKQDSETHQRLH